MERLQRTGAESSVPWQYILFVSVLARLIVFTGYEVL